MSLLLTHLFSKKILSSPQIVSFCSKKTSEIKDKVAIVTGGASGIGYSITKEFLENGIASVTIVDINVENGEKIVKNFSQQFGDDKITFIEADVAESKQLNNAFEETLKRHNNINIVVNNAGIMNDIYWDRQIRTNLSGNIIGTLLGMQYMSKSSSGNGGTIINIASIMSMIPSSGYPLHTMTQFGIVGLTKALGCGNHYERTNVKIFAICPGLTKTDLLENAPKNTINENFSKEFLEEIEDCESQQPESVAKGLVNTINEANSGSIWVIERNGQPYEVNFPQTANLKMRKAL